jgi:hypothetical protein
MPLAPLGQAARAVDTVAGTAGIIAWLRPSLGGPLVPSVIDTIGTI